MELSSHTNHVLGPDEEVFVAAHWNVFLHEAEVVEATDKQPAAAHPQVEVQLLGAVPAQGQANVRIPKDSATCRASAGLWALPRDVVLHVLRQVHVQHDEVVQMAPTEGPAEGPASQVAVPLAYSEHRVQADLRRELHVLQHHLQGNVAEARAAV